MRDRRGVDALLLRRAQQLVTRPAPHPAYEDRPLPDRSLLARIAVPALVVSQAEDALHPADLAVELQQALPHAALLALPAGGVFWTAARDLQHALADHLSDPWES